MKLAYILVRLKDDENEGKIGFFLVTNGRKSPHVKVKELVFSGYHTLNDSIFLGPKLYTRRRCSSMKQRFVYPSGCA